MTPKEQLRLATISSQEQEWTEGRNWYRESDKEDVLWFFETMNEGTRESIAKMSDDEIAVMCRLGVLALIEIVHREMEPQ